jgi:hypothetical protein
MFTIYDFTSMSRPEIGLHKEREEVNKCQD